MGVARASTPSVFFHCHTRAAARTHALGLYPTLCTRPNGSRTALYCTA